MTHFTFQLEPTSDDRNEYYWFFFFFASCIGKYLCSIPFYHLYFIFWVCMWSCATQKHMLVSCCADYKLSCKHSGHSLSLRYYLLLYNCAFKYKIRPTHNSCIHGSGVLMSTCKFLKHIHLLCIRILSDI